MTATGQFLMSLDIVHKNVAVVAILQDVDRADERTPRVQAQYGHDLP